MFKGKSKLKVAAGFEVNFCVCEVRGKFGKSFVVSDDEDCLRSIFGANKGQQLGFGGKVQFVVKGNSCVWKEICDFSKGLTCALCRGTINMFDGNLIQGRKISE